jgi:AI-2 transport protein TqsA
MSRDVSPALVLLVTCAALVVVIAGMRAAAPLLTPLLLSIFLAVLTAPLMFYLCERGLPTVVALLLVVSALVVFGVGLGALIGGSLNAFSANLPGYEESLKTQAGELRLWLESVGLSLPQETFRDLIDPSRAMKLAAQLISGLGGVLADAFLILLTVIFLLFEAAQLPAKLNAVLGGSENSMQRLESIARNINRYTAIKALTSLLTGVGIALCLLVIGVDYPILWGLLAVLLNFVPNIGSIIAAVPAVLLAQVQLGPAAALWTVAAYLVINGLVGNLLEPRVMGRGLGLSTLVVFVSLVFWGWVLGPVGMFLSVPLTMTLKIALDSSSETRPAAVLLGSEVPRDRPG